MIIDGLDELFRPFPHDVTTIFGITCYVYVDISSETNFVSNHFLNGIITGAYSPFILIHKLIDNKHLYVPAKYYIKCRLHINDLCDDYTFVVFNIPVMNAIVVGVDMASRMLRSSSFVSDVTGCRSIITKFFKNNNICNSSMMSSGDEKFEKHLKEWEKIEKEKEELYKLKKMQNERLKEFEELIERKRKENIMMREQLKERDEILKKVGLKPVLPFTRADVDISATKPSKSKSMTDFL